MKAILKRESAISRVIRLNKNQVKRDECEEIHVEIAETLEQKYEGYSLGFINYLHKGYVEPNAESPYLIYDYDNHKETMMFNAYDGSGEIVGTVSLVCNNPLRGLPSDEVFSEELNQIKKQFTIAEVTRLAVRPDRKDGLTILFKLFNLMYLYSKYVQRLNAYVIEVSKSHHKFYEKYLLFQSIGEAKIVPRVNNDGILCCLDFNDTMEEIKAVGGSQGKKKSARGKTAYSHFIHESEELDYLNSKLPLLVDM